MIKKLFRKGTKAFRLYVLRDPFLVEARRWFKSNGDETFRLDYPLHDQSIVFDVGGYRGDFAQRIFDRFQCHIYIFEPMPEFYVAIRDRFSGNPKVRIFNFGLSDMNGKMNLFVSGDESSFIHSANASRTIQAEKRNIVEFLGSHDISHVDLIKINIEGGEYELIPALIDADQVRRFRNLQIQFHDFIPNAVALRDVIRSNLAKTHHQTWCFRFVWENWTLNEGNTGSAW